MRGVESTGQLQGQAKRGAFVLEGQAAINFLQSDEFQARSRELYRNCPWATANQNPDFITAWYTCYSDYFSPELILDYVAQDVVSGYFALAVDVYKAVFVLKFFVHMIDAEAYVRIVTVAECVE